MSNPTSQQDPTADYRKYPKGPNFLLIVIAASVFILLALVAVVYLIGHRGGKMVPHPASRTPNSLLQPVQPLQSPARPTFSA